MKRLSSTDRKALIRLASSLPKGSEERKVLLGGLEKTAAKYRPDVKSYLRSKGKACPFCGHDDLDPYPQAGVVRCENCQAMWADITEITGIDVAREPEPIEDLEEPPVKGSPMSYDR